MYDTIVIGGGASGLAAAITAAESGRKTLLIEKGDRTGRKILASGNGRCNLMNSGPLRYYGQEDFARAVFDSCPRERLIRFFNHYGLYLQEEKEGRFYPVTLKSATVLNILLAAARINHAEIRLHTFIREINRNETGFACLSTDGNRYTAQRLILCTGGAAQKKLGGSEDGYRYLRDFGHHISNPAPSLVPVATDAKTISGLSGIRVRCTVSLMDADTVLHAETGEVLFTDYGLSGICIMQCSRFIRKAGLHFELDLLSGIFPDQEETFCELRRRRDLYAAFSPVSVLEGILVPKLSFAVLKQAGTDLRDRVLSSVSDAELRQIVRTAYHYRCEVKGTRTLEEAQVTAGGARCDEFNPRTMESRLVRGLYAAGELLDVDGDCGGYNLMFAFATGMLAGGAPDPDVNTSEATHEKR